MNSLTIKVNAKINLSLDIKGVFQDGYHSLDMLETSVDIFDLIKVSKSDKTQVYMDNEEQDELFPEALEFVVDQQKASTSLIQRRFRIGYNRAARIIDDMEQRGYIGPANGSKPREVYKQKDDSSNQCAV